MSLAKLRDVDVLARRLAYLGQLGRNMPPTWQGGRHAPLVTGSDGAYLGRMLPGKGLRLGCDLDALGITRSLPHVYEDSLLRRLIDLTRSERGAVTTYDTALAAYQNRKAMGAAAMVFKSTNVDFNAWVSAFRVSGSPAAGSFSNIPGGAALNNASTGGFLGGLANPTAPDKAYILSLSFGLPGAPTFSVGMLADLLVAADNIDSNSNATQTINSAALTRYTSGSGVMATFVVTAGNLGSVASNMTITKYTNQSGTALQASPAQAMTVSSIVDRLTPATIGPWMQLQAGDYGVKSVEEIQLSAAMGTAGKTLALNLYYPLAFIPGVGPSEVIRRNNLDNIDGAIVLATEAGGALGCLNLYLNTPNSGGTDILLLLEVAIG